MSHYAFLDTGLLYFEWRPVSGFWTDFFPVFALIDDFHLILRNG
jgi:hypothetical protein